MTQNQDINDKEGALKALEGSTMFHFFVRL